MHLSAEKDVVHLKAEVCAADGEEEGLIQVASGKWIYASERGHGLLFNKCVLVTKRSKPTKFSTSLLQNK